MAHRFFTHRKTNWKRIPNKTEMQPDLFGPTYDVTRLSVSEVSSRFDAMKRKVSQIKSAL